MNENDNSQNSNESDDLTSCSKSQTREEAKTEADEEKKIKKDKGKILQLSAWAVYFTTVSLFLGIISWVLSGQFKGYGATLFLCLESAFILVSFVLLHRNVPEKEEWIIEFFGKWITTWEPGLHLFFPFFMYISGKVYLGDQIDTLYMDEQERDGEIDALIDFKNTSASVIVRIFWRIFSSHRAIYEIDDVRRAVREKMDAGVRAYFGKQDVDQAIEERASLNLELIIREEATEAAVFKCWGVEIISIAVTDIGLPDDVKKQRDKILQAEKDRDAAEIEVEKAKFTAKAEVHTKEGEGKAIFKKIKAVSKKSDLTDQEAVAFFLNEDYFQAITTNKGIVISGKGTNAPLMGAELGAGFDLTRESLEGGENVS